MPLADAIAAIDSSGGAEARLALTEALLLLSASEDACAAMRSAGVFPVLRESRSLLLLTEDETHRPVVEANERLVSAFHLQATRRKCLGSAEEVSKTCRGTVLQAGGTTHAPQPSAPRGQVVWELLNGVFSHLQL